MTSSNSRSPSPQPCQSCTGPCEHCCHAAPVQGICGHELSAGLTMQGSIITGVLFVTFISWIPGHGASYLGAGSTFPGQAMHL